MPRPRLLRRAHCDHSFFLPRFVLPKCLGSQPGVGGWTHPRYSPVFMDVMSIIEIVAVIPVRVFCQNAPCRRSHPGRHWPPKIAARCFVRPGRSECSIRPQVGVPEPTHPANHLSAADRTNQEQPSGHRTALGEIEGALDAPEGREKADKLGVPVALVESHEERRWPIEVTARFHPVDALHYAIDELGHTQTEFADLLGSPSRASEILAQRQALAYAT